MSATLLPYQQFFNPNTGDFLSGGLVYSYEAGSSTPKDMYSSSAGTTALSNPAVLTSSGLYAGGLWGTGSYKLVVKDSTGATTVLTVDNVSLGASSVATQTMGNITITGNTITGTDDVTITSSTDTHSVNLTPTTTGTVNVKGNASQAGWLTLQEQTSNGTNTTTIKPAASLTANRVIQLPDAEISIGSTLTTTAAVSIGAAATTTGVLTVGTGGLVVGSGGVTTGTGAVSFGNSAFTTSTGATSIGTGGLTTSTGAVTFGTGAKAFGTSVISLGAGTITTSTGNISTGTGNITTSSGAITTGAGAVTFGAGAFNAGTAAQTFPNYTVGPYLIQRVYYTDRALSGGAGGFTTPFPNTSRPVITDGFLCVYNTITPKSASHILKITAVVVMGTNAAGELGLGLFNLTAGGAALATVIEGVTAAGIRTLTLVHYVAAGSTSPVTFYVQGGTTTGGVGTWMNGYGGAASSGGYATSSLEILEHTS